MGVPSCRQRTDGDVEASTSAPKAVAAAPASGAWAHPRRCWPARRRGRARPTLRRSVACGACCKAAIAPIAAAAPAAAVAAERQTRCTALRRQPWWQPRSQQLRPRQHASACLLSGGQGGRCSWRATLHAATRALALSWRRRRTTLRRLEMSEQRPARNSRHSAAASRLPAAARRPAC
eukprot:366197-Chlamydomonas_euryale.AAC.12